MTVLNNFEARFLALHAQLQQHEQYWRSSPYREPQLSWLQTNPALADAAVAHLSPLTARYNELVADPAAIDAILQKGAEKAAALANPILSEARELVGLQKHA